MSREGRTLLLLAVFALGAVAVLGSIAKRYGTMIEERGARSSAGSRVASPAVLEDAPGAIDAFADVREAIAAALARRASEATVEATLREARDRAIAGRGLSVQRYEAARAAYRRWRIGAPLPDELAEVFASRAIRLREADLGAYESLDR